MKYNAIKMAIPIKWKQILRKNTPIYNNEVQNTDYNYIIEINNTHKPISKLTNKDIYRSIIKSKGTHPTAINTWLDNFFFLENNINWDDVFLLPYKVSKEPYTFRAFNTKYLIELLTVTKNCIHGK